MVRGMIAFVLGMGLLVLVSHARADDGGDYAPPSEAQVVVLDLI